MGTALPDGSVYTVYTLPPGTPPAGPCGTARAGSEGMSGSDRQAAELRMPGPDDPVAWSYVEAVADLERFEPVKAE